MTLRASHGFISRFNRIGPRNANHWFLLHEQTVGAHVNCQKEVDFKQMNTLSLSYGTFRLPLNIMIIVSLYWILNLTEDDVQWASIKNSILMIESYFGLYCLGQAVFIP